MIPSIYPPPETSAKRRRERGFTLIEIIVTLVIVAFLSVILASFYRISFEASSGPVVKITGAHSLKRVMENITAHYRTNPQAAGLLALRTDVGVAGQTYNNAFGQYTVVNNKFIKFVNRLETDIQTGDPQNLLKITVSNNLGEILTAVFSSQ